MGNYFTDFAVDNVREFLQSDAYLRMMTRLAVGLTGKMDLVVCYAPKGSPHIAYTDKKKIYLNTQHEMFENEPIENVTVYCLALIVHESLHPMYTDFVLVKESYRRQKDDINAVECNIRGQIFNILEDARIERIGAFKFPGVAYALDDLNLFLYRDRKQAKEDFEAVSSYLWEYAIVGLTKQILTEHQKEIWNEIKPLVKEARLSDVCQTCYNNAVQVTRKLIQLIPFTNMPQVSLGGKFRNADSGQGNTGAPMPINTGGDDYQSERRKKQDEQDGSTTSQGGSNQKSQQSSSESVGDPSGGKESEKNNASANSDEKQQSKDGNCSNQNKPSWMNDENLQEVINGAIKDAVQQYQHEKTDKMADKGFLQQNYKSQKLTIAPITPSIDNMSQYNQLRAKCLPIINQFIQKLERILNYNQDETRRYLSRGKIDGKSLSRILDGNVCAKRIEKTQESELHITLLLDSSGSMSEKNRNTSAVLATVVFQEVCKKLKIPIAVVGFSGGTFEIFTDHKLKNRNAQYNIVKFLAGGGTPLGEALEIVRHRLKSVKEADKIVIVVTDGKPNDSSLVLSQLRALKSDGIKVYGLAIGQDKEDLQKLFGVNCIYLENLKQLPDHLCRIIEKNILKQ